MAEFVGALHQGLVHGRRVRVLANRLAAFIPARARVLDVGCGDGALDSLIAAQRPDVSIEGIDVLVRPEAHIPVRPFDGAKIPYPDATFDIVMFVDVLHHTLDPKVLLSEAARVGKMVLIKDHFREGLLAGPTLRFMDWVGNAHHGVALPYNYWSKSQWNAALEEVKLKTAEINESLGLYPPPASWLFERNLHFVATLEPSAEIQVIS
ncbi:MAG: class I SAM-dependent methyltransferase [Candidatus Acidiferrales bacterium]